MRVVVQRSKKSKVTVNECVEGSINEGFVLLVGFTNGDNEKIVDKMVDKIINLRVFKDENDLMNLSLLDVKGSILNISQFTLYADCKKGRRPSFAKSLNPEDANILYDYMNESIRKKGIDVQTGIFGASMKVEIYNDGPVTVILDSEELF